jgi:hypothetical protein
VHSDVLVEHSKANRLPPVETQLSFFIYTKLHVSFVTGHHPANNMMAVNDRNSKLMLYTVTILPFMRRVQKYDTAGQATNDSNLVHAVCMLDN